MRISFDRAHTFTAGQEGGLSDHAADPGGITNYGISLRWLQEVGEDINGDGQIDADDIRACSVHKAASLLREAFWLPVCGDSLPAPLAVFAYDTAVNCGVKRAVRLLQVTCNIVAEAHLDAHESLVEDGIMGPQTLRCCRALEEAGLAYYVARASVRRRKELYKQIIAKNPQLAVFRRGWDNRCAALLEYLAGLEREE